MHMMIYKADFVVWSLVDIGWFVTTLVFYQLLYGNVTTIAGWTKPEVLLLQGVYFMTTSILWGIFWNNFRELPIKINQGTLDFDLIKPIDAQFILSLKHLDFDNFNSFVLGVLTVVYSIHLGSISVSGLQIMYAFTIFVFGLILFYSLYFSTMCLAFWFDRIENLPWLFPSVREFLKTPQPFFTGALRVLFVYMFPVILITSVPTQILLGIKSTNFVVILLISSVISLAFSRLVFSLSIKKYSSASS